MSLLLNDQFSERKRAGQVDGTAADSGHERQVIDEERVISVDADGLRIEPIIKTGWNRAGVAYGPFKREDGLTMAVFMLNGHNTSEATNLSQSIPSRLKQWVVGSTFAYRVNVPMLMRRLTGSHGRRVWRRWRWWLHLSRQTNPDMKENLAVGFFPSAALDEAPTHPDSDSNAFVVHATNEENGELWVSSANGNEAVLRGLQNIQTYYVVAMRQFSTMYYAASVPDAHGLAPYPTLRPMALSPKTKEEAVYAGIHQSASSQIGFRIDTRVYGVRVAEVDAWKAWYGSAHAADLLMQEPDEHHATHNAEVGGAWEFHYAGEHLDSFMLLKPPQPSGLVSMMFGKPPFMLVFRAEGETNLWRARVTDDAVILEIERNWKSETVARAPLPPQGLPGRLQVTDDGRTIHVSLNSEKLISVRDDRLSEACGVGTMRYFKDVSGMQFEAHPRAVALPDVLDMGAPWLEKGSTLVAEDDFADTSEGAKVHEDIHGKALASGGKTWERILGTGVIERTENGAQARANLEAPIPDRTLYTIGWDAPEFADLEVTMTAPGRKQNEGHRGRGGLVLWQDDRNYIIINTWLDDYMKGASVSSFFIIDGVEEIYDAVWSNVGGRIQFGKLYRLRVVFDGLRYTAMVNDEPVLYRSLTDVYPSTPRLKIQRVGIALNWEWGHDTGTAFHKFTAKRR